jgi:hypothetical protein
MTVINFPQKLQSTTPRVWPPAQLAPLIRSISNGNGAASGWELGTTESGDPQLYLLGPAPDYECILCISRLGQVYVIEDGQGQILHELDTPMLLAERALAALRHHKTAFLARVVIACCALRETIKEKAEVWTAEPMELLTHIAPQLSALA